MQRWIPLTIAALALSSPAPATADPVPGSLRVVVVPQSELLPSESRALGTLKAQLFKRPPGALAEATPAEASFAAASFAGGTPALPREWLASQTVLVLQVLSPMGKKPSRVSRGLGAVVLFRPPQAQPVYRETIAGEAGSPLSSETLPGWIARAVALSAQSSPGGGK